MTALPMTEGERRLRNAADISGVRHDEAGRLATVEAERLSALVESLACDEWDQPTDCSESGAAASLASGRLPAETALARATIERDPVIANWFLNQADVPY